MAGRGQLEFPELVYGLVVAQESEILVAYPNFRLFHDLSKDALEQLPPHCARFTLGFDDAIFVFWRCQGVVYMLGCHACFSKIKSWELLGKFRRTYLQAAEDLKKGRWLGNDPTFLQKLALLLGDTRGKMMRSLDLVMYPGAPDAYRTTPLEPPPPPNPNWKSLQEELEDFADSDEDTEVFLDTSSELMSQRESEGSAESGEMVRSESNASRGHCSWSMKLSVQNDLRGRKTGMLPRSKATADKDSKRGGAVVPRAAPVYDDYVSRSMIIGKPSIRSRVSYQSQELSRVSPEEGMKVMQTDSFGPKQVRENFVSERNSLKSGVISETSPSGLSWEEHIRRDRVAHGLNPPRPFSTGEDMGAPKLPSQKHAPQERPHNATMPPAPAAPGTEAQLPLTPMAQFFRLHTRVKPATHQALTIGNW